VKKHLYLIALMPPDEISQQITLIKKDFCEKYSSTHALKSPAHITLQMPFSRSEEDEKIISGFLSGFSKPIQAFKIELSGFGHFEKRVIFIDIKSNDALHQLYSNLQKDLLSNKIIIEKEQSHHFHPHITVAHRDLIGENFSKAWNAYKNAMFEDSFEAGKIFLLKHNFKFWEVLQGFEFAKAKLE
jgi:2'-5' RNA ligase